MTPYDMVEKLIDKYGVADVLLMVSDIISVKSETIEVGWLERGLIDKWMKAGKIVRQAVKDLPKAPGIK